MQAFYDVVVILCSISVYFSLIVKQFFHSTNILK